MTEEEMNSYRFGSGTEPTDEMLAQLMSEVAAEAREKNARATQAHLEQMRQDIKRKQQLWAEKIKSIANAN